jgi:hypothetical protein
MSGRPPADALVPVMLEMHAKLTRDARSRGVEVRCPTRKRHLLAAVVQTMHGPWVVWRGDPRGSSAWLCAWRDDSADAARLSAWCDCDRVWAVDVSSPAAPTAHALG